MSFSKNRIYLVGFMGSGKSTIGAQLAAQLRMDFLDTDSMIETLKSQSISSIFKSKGESYFRQEEKKVLGLLEDLDNYVFATGGGFPIYEDNMSRMLQSGLVIYLDCSAEVLKERLLSNQTQRPLLAKVDSKQISSSISKLLNERSSIYEKAHLSADATGNQSLLLKELCLKIQPDLQKK